MKTKIVLIALLTFFYGCQTCLKQEDFKELELKSNFTNKDFSHLNGEYKRIIYDILGNESLAKCSTWFNDGVIKHHSGKLINIKNPRLVIKAEDLKAYEFTDNKVEYQIYIDSNTNHVELLSLNLWDIYKKIEEKKNED